MDWVSDLNEFGYARIPGVFDPHECEQIKEFANFCLLKDLKGRTSLQTCGGKPILLLWPQDTSQVIREFSRDYRLANIAESVLGKDILHLNNQIYFREPNDGDEFAWHQDITFRIPKEDFIGIETSYLQTIIAIDPITEENGPIEFIPGSHKKGDLNLIPGNEEGLRKFVRGDWKGEKLLANRGDVLVWSVMVVHGSEQNKSRQSRTTFMNGFAKTSAVVPGKFDHYLIDGVRV